MADPSHDKSPPSTPAPASSGSAVSPSATIRQQRTRDLSPVGQSGPTDPSSRNVGLGHPRGGPSTDFTPVSPVSTITSMGTQRRHSISSGEESDTESRATPRNPSYFTGPYTERDRGERDRGESRRLSDVRGYSQTASPNMGATNQAGGTMGSGRGGRSRLPGAAGERTGTLSRSASRVRLPPHTPVRVDTNTDDEVEFIDRGEDLIRRRIKERKRAKRERERELRLQEEAAEDEDIRQGAPVEGESLAGSALLQPPHRTASASPSRSRVESRHRSASGARQPSTGIAPWHRSGSQGEADHESVAPVPEDDEERSIHQQDDDGNDLLSNPDLHDDGYDEDESESGSSAGDDEGVTLKDRQDAINIEHPFGLPIWKPALYRKSRSVTRNAESALHSMPSAAAERHLLPGNIVWVLLFGWWLALTCAVVALIVSAAEVIAGGRGGYGKTLRGLAWYIGWPFGKYVEGEGAPDDDDSTENGDDDVPPDVENAIYGATASSPPAHPQRSLSVAASTTSSATVRGASAPPETLPDEPRTPQTPCTRRPGVSFAHGTKSPQSLGARTPDGENTPLVSKGYFRRPPNRRAKFVGSIFYWPAFYLVICPVMLFVCTMCWFLVVTIPMAKLTWELLNLLWCRPLEINFRAAPKVALPSSTDGDAGRGQTPGSSSSTAASEASNYTVKRARLKAGQIAPTAGPTSTVLLCTYRAIGLQYYKYTVGGVNIMFINLLPLVFFTIIDGIIILPRVERAHEEGRHVAPILTIIANQGLIFMLGIASVIPLSYFIGMAVASISAQSSIGMGAVINATFGSIIEIVLYGIALTQGKGRLVEGSIVGSILAGVLLMPGASMCSGAFRRKEQKFNAKSAGVTSTMLIMAIIGTLTPTLFYQTYGSFQIMCDGCPEPGGSDSWHCNRCYYTHPEPTTDPFYQNQVKTLMYSCAAILLLSYLIGLWFSLRTHASQIWQNPNKVMAKDEMPIIPRPTAVVQRITPAAVMNPVLPVHSKPGSVRNGVSPHRNSNTSPRRPHLSPGNPPPASGASTGYDRRPSVGTNSSVRHGDSPNQPFHTGYTPFLESLDRGMKSNNVDPMPLPAALTMEDFRRAVHQVATSSGLHTHKIPHDDHEEEGGHDAPSWTRGTSAAVLLSCTLLYAIIAEVLVDVVDVVLQGSGVDEKFLGLTLFALVPNTTEFMNAMSFAMNGNIALSMEIGSAYALQVCLLQIPAMVAFSALFDPSKVGDQVDTFTLIFPRWDVIAIVLAIFLLTYTYIEARSNYHRGSILVLAYCVLVMGFYYAPTPVPDSEHNGMVIGADSVSTTSTIASSMSLALTKLWA